MNRIRTVLPIGVLVAASACEAERPATDDAPDRSAVELREPPAGTSIDNDAVEARFVNRDGQFIGGAILMESPSGVRIQVRVAGLPPGPKGMHIHQMGRCDPPAFESAGGHFAPEGREHGLENPRGPHAGDLPNLRVAPDGRADTTLVATRVTLAPDSPTSLSRPGGTALVIHERADDHRTDPSGDSGARIACGVIAAH